MQNRTQLLQALRRRTACQLLAITGVFMAALVTNTTAQADWKDYARDGRYCDGNLRNEKGEFDSPFLFKDLAIMYSQTLTFFCGGDVETVREFWRDYFRYFGCSDESEMVRALDTKLHYRNFIDSPSFKKLGEVFSNHPKACEIMLSGCNAPRAFDPDTADQYFTCDFDEEFRAYKESNEYIEREEKARLGAE